MAIKFRFNKGHVGDIRLDHLMVRLVEDEVERKQWRDLVKKYHYLHNATSVGEQLLYVVECRGKCVALLSFSMPSWHLLPRDRFIGWNEIQRRKRLHLIAQNNRFLIMPGIQTRNLASKVLSLCLNRLNDDWLAAYQHPVLMVETFVDKMFPGTSYRADNWIRLGETQGFTRTAGEFYIENSAPKTIWVKPLRPGAIDILKSAVLPVELARFERELDIPALVQSYASQKLESLFDYLTVVPDSRAHNRRHRLASCLAIIACGFLAGCEGLAECAEFGKTLKPTQKRALRFRFDKKTREWDAPSHPTLWRVMGIIDPVELQRVISDWYNGQSTKVPTAIALDGKTLCGSLDEKGNALHGVSAVSHSNTPPFFSRRPQTTKAMRERRLEISSAPCRTSTERS